MPTRQDNRHRMEFIDEIRKHIEDSTDSVISTSDGTFLECSNGTAVIPVAMKAMTLKEAEEAHARLDGLTEALKSRAPERKTIIVPEDLWRARPEMMQARLLAQFGRFRPVFARNTSVRRITAPEAATFLDRWHTYGNASSRYRYGLFTKSGDLVAVAAFSSGRKWVKGDRAIRSYEWVRYASLPDVRVTGGMGKVLKAFIRDVNPDDIMSYADLEWTDGQTYTQLGFREDGFRAPVTFRIDTSTWRRTPLAKISTERAKIQAEGYRADAPQTASILPEMSVRYHMNLGSRKFRLTVTQDSTGNMHPSPEKPQDRAEDLQDSGK